MFSLTHPIPKQYYVACSGGVDSMVALHWLSFHRPERVLGVLYVHHNTGSFADESENVVKEYCKSKNIPLTVHKIKGVPIKGRSKEDWWREQRYNFFDSVNATIVLAHHFDDCLEEYLMCSLVRGYASTIQYARNQCIRPFRLWKKVDIVDYARRNKIKWAEDPSNTNTNYKRNFIRHELVPRVLELNPGVYNIVERLIRNDAS